VTLGVVTTGKDVLSVSDRDRILQAMADCCAGAGYAETTVEAVLERADVDAASFASHFAGKEECALAALNKIVSETLAQISMAGTADEETAGRRTFEGKAILELMAARPSFARLAFIESRQGGTTRMHDSYESAVRVLALMMERVGGVAERPNPSARAALGGAEAVIRRELAASRAARLPRLLPDFVYAVLVPLVGQGEALRQAKLAARFVAEEER
jgi:AcrR family transcriptional regulator